MSDQLPDARTSVDPRVTTPGREGLTGTAPANLYSRSGPGEELTIAPDFRPLAAQPAWRQDFPIDWPQDRYVERRDFMKFMVLTSLAMTVGQFWIAAQNWRRRREGLPELTRITSVDEIAVGGTVVFDYPPAEGPCVLVRITSSEFVAYSQKCTHLSCAVIPRPAEGTLHCPCHEGLFDLRTGRPTSGPPKRPLPRVLLEFRGREIYARGVEWRTV